jgi:hypothetical protein
MKQTNKAFPWQQHHHRGQFMKQTMKHFLGKNIITEGIP